MKKIIVPIDYSEASDSSINIAKKLCEIWDAELEVVFCWRPHLEAEMVSTGGYNVKETVHLEKLIGFLGKHNLPTKSGKLLTGLAGDVITEISKDESTLMIVMGTVGEYGLLEKIIGGVASQVMKNAECPILLVPPKVITQGRFKNILVAGEIESTDENSLLQIIDFTKRFNAKVDFANVSSFEQEDTGLHIPEELLEKITRQEDIGFPFSILNIYSESIEDGLNTHCEQNNIDLMILVTRTHSWWENILSNKTLIDPQRIAFDMNRPILTIRIEE